MCWPPGVETQRDRCSRPQKSDPARSPGEEIQIEFCVVRSEPAQMPLPTLIGAPGIETPGWSSHCALPLDIGDCGGDRDGDGFSDLILHREDVGEITVVAFGPNVVAALGLDQLRGDADAIAGLAQAAFQHVAHPEFSSDLFHVDRAARK